MMQRDRTGAACGSSGARTQAQQWRRLACSVRQPWLQTLQRLEAAVVMWLPPPARL
jgi:hypothetical protein